MRAAILIDGAYYLKRLPAILGKDAAHDPVQADAWLGKLVEGHLNILNLQEGARSPSSLLYRCFFYDGRPYTNRGHYPISKKAIDYSKSDDAIFRTKLFELILRRPSFALRLGEVRRDSRRAWIIEADAQNDLIAGWRQASDLTDADFRPSFRQKAVDMRIGVDIATITLKKQADTIILVAGDSDFVPAAKLARREGVKFILDSLWQDIGSPGLLEHIDELRGVLPRPGVHET